MQAILISLDDQDALRNEEQGCVNRNQQHWSGAQTHSDTSIAKLQQELSLETVDCTNTFLITEERSYEKHNHYKHSASYPVISRLQCHNPLPHTHLPCPTVQDHRMCSCSGNWLGIGMNLGPPVRGWGGADCTI